MRAAQSDNDPTDSLNWLRTELPDYWPQREALTTVLQYFATIGIDHWAEGCRRRADRGGSRGQRPCVRDSHPAGPWRSRRRRTLLERHSSRRRPLDASFLRPRLEGARGYDRIAGYFSSSILEVAGEAFDRVHGMVRIVCTRTCPAPTRRSPGRPGWPCGKSGASRGRRRSATPRGHASGGSTTDCGPEAHRPRVAG